MTQTTASTRPKSADAVEPHRAPTHTSRSDSRPISAFRSSALLLGLRFERLGRAFQAKAGSGPSAGARSAGTAKGGASLVMKGLLVASAFVIFTAVGMTQLFSLPLILAVNVGDLAPRASAHLLMLCFTAACLNLSWMNKDLKRRTPELEWLLTLPLSLSLLYALKALERAWFSASSWWLIYPFMVGLLRHQGLFWSAPLVGLALCLPLLLVLSVVCMLLEHWVKRLPGRGLETFQALSSLVGFALFMTLLPRPHWSAPLRALPWLPTDSTTAVVFGIGSGELQLVWRTARWALELGLLLGLGQMALSLIFRSGWAFGEGPTGRRSALGATPLRLGNPWFGALVAKDRLQLFRDKSTLYHAFVIPGLQLASLGSVVFVLHFDGLLASSQHLPALAFGMGSMALLMTAPLALPLEGRGLWLLFTLPRRLETLLLTKSLVWTLLASGYTGVVLAVGLFYQPLSLGLVEGALYGFAGLALLSLTGTLSGVFMTDPRAVEREEGTTRGTPSALLLALLAAVFALGFYADSEARISLTLLLGAVTFGAWQSAARELPFLLDPVRKPAPIISLADGLTCVFLFCVLQGAGYWATTNGGLAQGWAASLISFAGAGALVVGGALLVFQARGLSQLVNVLVGSASSRRLSAVGWGLAWGVPAAMVAQGYAYAIQHWPWLTQQAEALASQRPALETDSQLYALLLLALVAAPLFEELIFRGLVYRGLRESLSPAWSAALCATLFAMAHPSLAFVPVFSMAIFASLAFERSRCLISPILVHAAYNGSLLAAPAWMT